MYQCGLVIFHSLHLMIFFSLFHIWLVLSLCIMIFVCPILHLACFVTLCIIWFVFASFHTWLVMQTLRSCDCGAGECQAGVKYVDQLEDVLRFSMPKDKCGAFFAESIQVHVSFQCSCSRVILKLFNMRYLSFRNWFWIGYFILSADIGVRFIHDT